MIKSWETKIRANNRMMNTRKLRILVDMDSTVAGFNERIATQWNIKYPDYPALLKEQLTNWKTDECYGAIHGEWAIQAVRDIYQGPDFFNNLELFGGAVQALNDMLKTGHEVFFCTSPLSKYQHCVLDKYTWIEKYFGCEWIKRIILTGDKTFISADYIIDDKPKITGVQDPPLWKHIYFTQPYNLKCPGPRITHWSEWRDVINNLEA